MERRQQIVIPVFYNVDPSHVRHQTGTFAEAMDKHLNKFKEKMVKVQSWRSALNKAANLSGIHFPSKYQNESELIEEIVNNVLGKLSHIFPRESKGLVGIDKSVECIESLLEIGSREVRIIGIWGMGGLGKTTIGQVLFDKYSSQYEGCCFMENVREKSQKYGLPYLVKKLVSELLEGENLLLKGLAKSQFTNVKRRLSRKRVFIVLDDVNTVEQLEHLTREQICLGPGSRVIITTRDKHVLRRVAGIHEVKKLTFEKSRQLFCLNAFGKIYPETGYEKLTDMAVGYANGVPLALKVLGSFLHSRTVQAWESALRKLKNCPNREIHNVLKFSYEELDDLERNIFLDIAFFFKGKEKDAVIRLLDSFGFCAAIGIDNLERKSLVTISDDNTIEMHDLIEQMGLEIVRQESTQEPGNRSRLKDPEDVYNVLKNNRGTELVEGIILELSASKDLQLNVDTFKKMSNLRFLKFYNRWDLRWLFEHNNPITLDSISDKLRYLEWIRCPLKSLPSTFCAEKLVVLGMPQSLVSKLWDGIQDLVNLKEVHLRECKRLVELPDFSKASNLKKIDLAFCESLRCIHPSILSIHTLEELNLHHCKELKSLKGEIHLKSLKYLEVNGCSSLQEFSVSSEELQWLDLNQTRINRLHSSIGCLGKLERFYLSELRLKSLPNELCFLTSLQELWLPGCQQLIELPHNIKALSQLKVLHLRNCRGLRFLPELPLSIMNLDATNCMSLGTIFSIKAVFTSNKTYISFQNCGLDEHSAYNVMEGSHLTMVRAAIRNLLVRSTHPSEKRRVSEVRYPGSKVPEWFRYQTRQASITLELDKPEQLLGFFVCCVIPRVPSNKIFHHIECKFYLGDGKMDRYKSRWHFTTVYEGLNSDHVYIRYDPSPCDKILEDIKKCRANDHCTTYNQKVSFEFITKPWECDGDKVEVEPEYDCSVKECGICPIYVSDIHRFIQKKEIELKLDDDKSEELDLSALIPLISLKMKEEEEPIPQSKKLDLISRSNSI